LAACDEHTKIIWICSPNNPTGNLLDKEEIIKTIELFDGIVILDEAYSDFSNEKPLRSLIKKYQNLIVLNTMSKAWGCAAIRLGMAFASKEIIDLCNKVKYPYNINILTQRQAMEILKDPYQVVKWVNIIKQERSHVMDAFRSLPICEKVFRTDSNFFLAKMKDAQAVYDYLVNTGIIVRNRNKVKLCGNCLRITIGKKSENEELLAALRQY
jgi:histidinol-phosphate aminotransferase